MAVVVVVSMIVAMSMAVGLVVRMAMGMTVRMVVTVVMRLRMRVAVRVTMCAVRALGALAVRVGARRAVTAIGVFENVLRESGRDW